MLPTKPKEKYFVLLELRRELYLHLLSQLILHLEKF